MGLQCEGCNVGGCSVGGCSVRVAMWGGAM